MVALYLSRQLPQRGFVQLRVATADSHYVGRCDYPWSALSKRIRIILSSFVRQRKIDSKKIFVINLASVTVGV